RDDFEEVFQTTGLPGSLLTKSSFHNRSEHFVLSHVFLTNLSFLHVFNQMVLIFYSFKGFSDLEDFWDDLPVSCPKYNALDDFQEVFQITSTSVSSGLPESRLDFLEVIWKSSGLLKSRLDFMETTYNSVVRQATYLKHISKSITKITSALTRRLSAHIRLLQAHIRLLQAYIISNESDPPIIVSFYDFMNHKKCKIKILEFFSSMWREKWKKKKGNFILGALRASNWLFMLVKVLMTMTIL
ncbi:hypothetical protein IGI04_040703, partial [Brassica rapa subsp. trilocularis]